jgi:hypothetical protein
MSWLLPLSLIQLFLVYLTLVFLIGTALRIRDYRHALGLVLSVPGRWPRLFQLVKQHHSILLTWRTILPLALSFGLLVAHTFTSEFVWPRAAAVLTVGQLLETWPALLVVAPAGVFMIGLDVYVYRHLSPFNRTLLEKYLDQAEYWLKSWKAPVVRIFTFGYINPRQMVATEVRTALEGAGRMMNTALWWVSLQTGARLAFGLALWGAYVAQPWLLWLVGAAPG